MMAIQKISDFLEVLYSFVCAFLMSLLTIVLFVGVIFRFVLNHPLQWTFEFSILCFSWVIFLGMSLAFKKGEHMSLMFLVTKLTGKAEVVWKEILYVITLVFLGIAFIESFRISFSTWYQTYNTIPFSKGLFYLSMPFGALASIIHIINLMSNLIHDYTSGKLAEIHIAEQAELSLFREREISAGRMKSAKNK